MNRLSGIDVSEWQTNVDYAGLKRVHGVEFAILRSSCGQRQDYMFSAHVNGFRSAGIEIKGIYHFIYAINEYDARRNAETCIKCAESAGLPKSTYLWCDFEYDSVRYAMEKGVKLSRAECNHFTRIFCDVVSEAGYRTGIYANQDYYDSMYEKDTLSKYPIWLCDIDGNSSPKYPCMVWQYSWKGYDWDFWYLDESESEKTNASLAPEAAITWMEKLATDDSHGYDQISRWGPDYDCSSAVISSWKTAGIPLSCTYTGNMKSDMLAHGFADVTSSIDLSSGIGLLRGDVLLNEVHHTAMYCGNGKEVEASINEHGGISGGKTGDQTGREILIRPYRNYPWDCVLRYKGDAVSIPENPTLLEPHNELARLSRVQMGDTGDSVVILQAILNILGYTSYDGHSLDTDGDFGMKTKEALIRYQKAVGLSPNGIASKKVWKKLKSVLRY